MRYSLALFVIVVFTKSIGIGAHYDNLFTKSIGIDAHYDNNSSYVPIGEHSEIDDDIPNEIPDDMANGFIGSSGLFTSDIIKVVDGDPNTAPRNSKVDDTPPPTVGPAPSWILEAEDANLTDSVVISTENPGYTGSGYADYVGRGIYAWIDWTFAETGHFNLQFRYARGEGKNLLLKLYINGEEQTIIQFPSTGDWANWENTEPFRVFLPPGTNTFRTSANFGNGPNVVSSV